MPSSEAPWSFLARDWSTLESMDRRYWAEAFTRSGADPALRASMALRAHMRRIRPDWPSAEERESDLRHHVAFKRLLDRAARDAAR